MQGSVHLESALGKGTEVRVQLLLPVVASLDEPAVGTAQHAAADTRFSAGQRVLVVEDHPTNQALMRWRLQQLGLDFVITGEGEAALHALESQAFDVVITDCRMPGMDGYAFSEALRDRERARGSGRLPVIALTANASAEEGERCYRAGMDDVLTKPVSLEQLCVALQRWLVVAASPDEGARLDDIAPVGTLPDWTGDLPTSAGLQARFGSMDVAAQIAATLDEALGVDLHNLEAAMARGDAQMACDALHRMAGGAGAAATPEIALHLRDLSAAVGREGIVPHRGAIDLVQRVMTAYRRAVAAIR